MAKITFETNFTDEQIAVYNNQEGYVQSENGDANDFFANKIMTIIKNTILNANIASIQNQKQEELKVEKEAVETSIENKIIKL